MKPKELRSRFEQVISQCPLELCERAEKEAGPYKIQLNWPGGALSFGDSRGAGEFTLHIPETESTPEFFQQYTVFPGDGTCDSAYLNDLLDDLITYADSLTLDHKVAYFPSRS